MSTKLGTVTFGSLEDVDRLLEDECTLQETQAAIQNLIRHVLANEVRAETAKRIAERAANTASCIANGIQPD